MKSVLLCLLGILFIVECNAQMGPGIVYTYSGGYRIKREFSLSTPLLKQGTNSEGAQADTFLVLSKSTEKNSVQDKELIVRAYPNPVIDLLFIENKTWTEGNSCRVIIVDMSGKELVNVKSTSPKETFNMSAFVPGTYQVKYYINEAFIITWKIVKL